MGNYLPPTSVIPLKRGRKAVSCLHYSPFHLGGAGKWVYHQTTHFSPARRLIMRYPRYVPRWETRFELRYYLKVAWLYVLQSVLGRWLPGPG
jgi:hypothetical protein